MEKELEGEINGAQEPLYCNVFKTPNGLFIEENLCKRYDVGDSETSKKIKGKKCIEVTEGEIKRITEKAKKENIELVPVYKPYFDLQMVLAFTV